MFFRMGAARKKPMIARSITMTVKRNFTAAG